MTPIGGSFGTFDLSLLAVGNRGGRVIFMTFVKCIAFPVYVPLTSIQLQSRNLLRFRGQRPRLKDYYNSCSMDQVDWRRGRNACVVHARFFSLPIDRFNSCIKGRATVAASDADGRITFVHVNCRRSNGETPSRYPNVEFTQANSSEPTFIDRRAVTAMKWINLRDKTDVSAFLLSLRISTLTNLGFRFSCTLNLGRYTFGTRRIRRILIVMRRYASCHRHLVLAQHLLALSLVSLWPSIDSLACMCH